MSKFSFPWKPNNWETLALFQKVRFTMNKFNENFSPYVDKLNAKELANKICGNELKIPKVIRILNGPNDIKESDINSNYIIKGAHGCNFNLNIEPNKKYNIDEVKRRLNNFNKTFGNGMETQYSYLKPKFFIEEKIEDKIYGKDGNAICYMLECIHGVPRTFVPYLKSTNQQRNFLFNDDKTLYPIEMNYEKFDQKFLFLKQFEFGEKNVKRMYDLACKLSKNFEFVRIDFYLGKNDDIYFSEFTFSPSAGLQNYPMWVETKLGKLWK